MITYYLEMNSKSALNTKAAPHDITVKELEVKNFQFNKSLYQLVGERWKWKDKSALNDKAWRLYAEADNLRTWVAHVNDDIAGYYELQSQDNGNVEIVYFGLSPNFIGMGYGGYLLTHAIQSAWAIKGTERVWVHTCSLDHPNALNNYKSRGFKVYDVVHS